MPRAAHAQTDSLTARVRGVCALRLQPAEVAGAGLLAGGVAFTFVDPLHEVAQKPNRWYARFDLPRVRVDDYLQYLPAAMPFALNICGVRGEHSLRDLACLTLLSYALGGCAARAVKNNVSVERPSGLSFNSFPSGHSFVSFVGAEIMRREYGPSRPWLAVGAYAVASLTALLRFHNNMHWLSDLAGGIGLALVSVAISYRFGAWWSGFKHRHFGRQSNTLSMSLCERYLLYWP